MSIVSKKNAIQLVFVSGFPVACSFQEPLAVGANEQFLNQALGQLGDVEKHTILLHGESGSYHQLYYCWFSFYSSPKKYINTRVN